jgi:predicted acyl esterase
MYCILSKRDIKLWCKSRVLVSLADRNPQKFVNIFEAKESDYQKATQKVYHQKAYPSFITFGVLKN